ncbi:hypothetical protein PVBG_05859 [Plasmodium vivax Brazil I]|uniref:Variable surface protein n=1 Tax=Plasmodium vivax (strain Brazil I) TaxID=1033975 RepID=A0A0J9T2E9_PLAV1|nr:hypothetical protein PVBG_05859 [Plasmodium vivax Brazil I]
MINIKKYINVYQNCKHFLIHFCVQINYHKYFTYYNFARTYNSYNSIFERVSKTSDNIYGEDCGNFKLKYQQSGDSLFINCQKSLFYINEIENVHGRNDSKKIEEGLVFIYYWLHENEFNNNNYKEDIKDIFKELLDLHNKYDGYASNVPDTFQYKIRNNLDDKLKDLYCLYDKLNKFKTGNGCENSDKCKCAEKCVDIFKKNNVECKSDNNKDFCKELHRFAQQFDDYITKNNTCDIEKVHVLLNKNPHISVILLPIVITLTITFFLLYKVITDFIIKCACIIFLWNSSDIKLL